MCVRCALEDLDELYPLLGLLPEFNEAVLAGGDDEVGPRAHAHDVRDVVPVHVAPLVHLTAGQGVQCVLSYGKFLFRFFFLGPSSGAGPGIGPGIGPTRSSSPSSPSSSANEGPGIGPAISPNTSSPSSSPDIVPSPLPLGATLPGQQLNFPNNFPQAANQEARVCWLLADPGGTGRGRGRRAKGGAGGGGFWSRGAYDRPG